MPLDLPYRLGKYELTRQIGQGATGKVYHALDTFSNQEVAVKLVDQAVLADPLFDEDCRKQFLNEASLAGRLAHPHIVTILEASVTQEAGYVVMEYVSGGNLVRHTKVDALLPIGNVLQVIFKCCGALDYAFRQGIIHRDIKPANIMVASGTDVKIADFGAAVFYSAQATQDTSIGTPNYMSPEQISHGHLTYHSDMYSLGIVSYQLLTGVRPFQAQTLHELFDAIAKKDALPPSAQRSDLPAELDPVILRMIAKNPDDRYSNWADLALELAEIGKFRTFLQDLPDSEKFNTLRAMNELREFSEPEIWELVQASEWNRYPARTVIVRENEPGLSLFILTSGLLKVTKQACLLNTIKAGECFGEMSYIQRGTNRQATLEAISEVVVAEFYFPALEKLSANCKLHFERTLLHSLVDRLVLAGDRIVQMRS
jgi:eukaryotic-like serine/threonine-protein kinase